MLSDGRIVDHELARRSCMQCGLGEHVTPPSPAEIAAFYDESYSLYAHAPGGNFEAARQEKYARWLDGLVGLDRVRSLYEVGCGNGSLMAQLRARYPGLDMSGVEPAPAAAAQAAALGFAVKTGAFGASQAPTGQADLVLSVNVMEHQADPAAFLRACREAASPEGRVVAICPDGGAPSTELLFHDHISSFTAAAMARLAGAAALRIVASETGEAAGLPGFRAWVFARGEASEAPDADAERIARERAELLEAWRTLDDRLTDALAPYRSVVGFGAGEMATLIRAYAPRAWSRLDGIVMDGGEGRIGELPISDYRTLEPQPGRAVLLLTDPSVQPALADRLRADGHAPVMWKAADNVG